MRSSKLRKQIHRAYYKKHHSISRIRVDTGLNLDSVHRMIEENSENKGSEVLSVLLEGLLLISILCLVSLMYYGIPLILHVWLKQPLPSLPPGGFHGVE
jgi:hypothetical protein